LNHVLEAAVNSLSDLSIREINFGSDEFAQMVELRNRVLRRPLGLLLSASDIEKDARDIHFVAVIGGEMVGCLILTEIDKETARMRQVAVDSSVQGRGVGRKLVEAFETRAQSLGFSKIILYARDSAIPFYLKLGYEAFGEPFTEVTLVHRKMRKSL
jgi:N-acetylglutamate synthase-like GNAT family acetyltransferase